MKLYEPHPSDPRVPAVVVEEADGARYLVRATATDTSKAYDHRQPYKGAVRRDPVANALRGVAWSLGVPGAMDAEVPEG